MQKKIYLGILLFLSTCFSLEAVSLRLQNETHYPLTAVILGADGSLLGEVEVKAQQIISWLNTYSRDGGPAQGPVKSITPMNVRWLYGDGEVFCISEQATNGSLVRTSQGTEKRYVKTQKQIAE